MDLEVSEDADIQKLLELRSKLMSQLQKAETNATAKGACPLKNQKRRSHCESGPSSKVKKHVPNWKRPKDSVVSSDKPGKSLLDGQKELPASETTSCSKKTTEQGLNSCPGSSNERSWSSFSNDTNHSALSKNQDDTPCIINETREESMPVDEEAIAAECNLPSTSQDNSHLYQDTDGSCLKSLSAECILRGQDSCDAGMVKSVQYLPACPVSGYHTFDIPSTSSGSVEISEGLIPAPPPPPIITDKQPNVTSSENTIVEEVKGIEESGDAAECMPSTCKGKLPNHQTTEGVEESDCDFLSSEDEDAIDSLLEKPFEDGQTGKIPVPEEGEKREKVVLAHRDTDYFDVLPEGWVEVTHSSGLPIYLHKASRVCTFSRPYFIGPGSVRHHSVPESAIPCLHQKRVLREVEERAKESEAALEEALKTSASNREGADREELAKLTIARLQAPGTKVQSAEDFKQRQLDPQALHEYAKKVFRFKTIQIYRFNKWSATRSFHRQKKMAEAERLGKLAPAIEVPTGRPTLPSNIQLITVPVLENNQKPHYKGFFLNPHGKTSVSILHEYVQKVLKSTISYEFEETRNSSTPYACSARLKINLNNRVMNAATIKEKLLLLQEKEKRNQELQNNGESSEEDFVVLGRGCGNSKKAAKLDAAKSALKVLIPAIDFDSEGIARTQKKESEDAKCEEGDAVALFDMLPIEDSRIPDLSARAGQPSPYLILQECLKRHAVHGDTEIKLRSERVKHQKHKFDMDVGKHRVSVICSNKREGKQMASQAMLKKLHPQFDNWGSLIRLYGQETQQKHQEARRCRQSIIKLQGSRDKDSSSLEPNKAILEKLRTEMLNVLKNKRERENVKTRPALSYSGEPLDAKKVAEDSEFYAKTHPDTQSTFKIDF